MTSVSIKQHMCTTVMQMIHCNDPAYCSSHGVDNAWFLHNETVMHIWQNPSLSCLAPSLTLLTWFIPGPSSPPHRSNPPMYSTKHSWYGRVHVTPEVQDYYYPGRVSPHSWYQSIPKSQSYTSSTIAPEYCWSYTSSLGIIPTSLGSLCQSIPEHRSYTGSPGILQGLPNLLGLLCQSIPEHRRLHWQSRDCPEKT